MKELNSFQLVKVPEGLTATVKSRLEILEVFFVLLLVQDIGIKMLNIVRINQVVDG